MSVTITKLTATFGNLENAVLTPSAGLTVLSAPNEGGKSTWSAFIRAMFYGIDTRERDKAGFLADKTRYQPWSGALMTGEMELDWEGKAITLRRTSTKATPFARFEAVYTASGDPVPGLTAANVGEALLGVSKEVFQRTAFVGQNSTAVTATPELERRIAALAATGQEDVSASATERTLKDWRNRRKANRSTGLIPQLEGELAALRGELADMAAARNRREEAEVRIAELENTTKELEWQGELCRRHAAKELNRRYGQAQLRLDETAAALEQFPPPPPEFAGLTAGQARALVKEREADLARMAANSEKKAAAQVGFDRKRKLARNLCAVLVPILAAGGLAMVIVGFFKALWLMLTGFGCMFAAVMVAIACVKAMAAAEKAAAALEEDPTPQLPPLPDAEAYAEALTRRESLERELAHCKERLADLAAQGGQPFDTLEFLPEPNLTAQEVSARLTRARSELERWRSQHDRAIGALNTDPGDTEARCSLLEGELAARNGEYAALTMAMEALDRANTALRERFSPALNGEAAAIFSALTGGKYTSLTLSRDLSALADGHTALALSAGTVDQLYLSLRLALCRLTLPGAPMVLDDALCAFDDSRMALALEYLAGQEGQTLLFTCHSREERWAEHHRIPTIQL